MSISIRHFFVGSIKKVNPFALPFVAFVLILQGVCSEMRYLGRKER